jgi:hypothetical protein
MINSRNLLKLKHNYGQIILIKSLKEYIGPPDKISNIREVKFEKDVNESKYESEYRLARESVNKWNHE